MIILVRHGRTSANARGLLLGRADPALDEVGRVQAVAVAQALRERSNRVTMIVSSPLARAIDTARTVAASVDPGTEPVVDERWIELDYGEFDQVPLAGVPAESWATWRRDVQWAPPGGESIAALGARVRDACTELAERAVTDDVVVVTHVSPVKAAVAWALEVGDEVAWRLYVAPGSITRIGVGEERRTVVRSFNETAHLESAADAVD